MASVTEILKLCRLCLVNDQVNISIFEEQGDIRQIFLKITACLPIKVSREDNLPKKICDGCLYKLELLYQFWNTTANAEKQLLTWLNQAGIEADSKTTQEAVAIALQTQAQHSVKEEVIDPPENTPEETTGDLTTEAEGFLLQQQLPFEPAGAQLSESGFTESQEDGSLVDTSRLIADTSIVKKSPPVDKKVDKSKLDDTIEDTNLDTNVDDNEDNDDSNMDDGGGPSDDEESEEEYQPPPKRSRRQAAIKAAKLVAQERDDDEDEEDEDEQEEDEEEENEEDVDDPELGTAVPKTEEESGSEGEGANPEAPNFVSVGTGDMEGAEEEEDNVKPGPSGVGKIGTEAPFVHYVRSEKTFEPMEPLKFEPLDGNMDELDYVGVKLEPSDLVDDRLECSAIKIEDPENFIKKAHKRPSKGRDKEEFYREVSAKKSSKKPSKDTDAEKFYCKICDLTFETSQRLINHNGYHRTNHRCRTCGQIFESAAILKKHRFNIHIGRRYKCDVTGCEASFFTPADLRKHKLSHIKDRKYACPHCYLKFRVEKQLKSHLDIHRGVFKYTCDKCGKGYSSKSALREHQAATHENVTYTCGTCSKVFRYFGKYQKHKKTHRVDAPPVTYACASCEVSFASRGALTKHEDRVHRGITFMCEVCGRSFATMVGLNGHKAVHSGTKSSAAGPKVLRKVRKSDELVECDLCQKRFKTKANRDVHMRLHSDEKPFVCHVCEKAFAAKSSLQAHLKTHGTPLSSIKTNL